MEKLILTIETDRMKIDIEYDTNILPLYAYAMIGEEHEDKKGTLLGVVIADELKGSICRIRLYLPDINKLGKYVLYRTSYETYDQNIKGHFIRMARIRI